MERLAIKGHETRGKEVIEILEMMGGFNSYTYESCERNSIFTISNYSSIINVFSSTNYAIFTLEQFLEKFPYKIGDKVQHKGATSCGSVFEVEKLLWEDNQVKYIVNRLWYNNDKVKVTSKDLQPYKEETMEEVLNYCKTGKITTVIFQEQNYEDKVELDLGDNYEIKVEDGKTYVVRKKPQYPKTYEECCKVLNITALELEILDVRNDRAETIYSKNLDRLLNSFRKLIICRDAYWKIAGDWKPYNDEKCYSIYRYVGEIVIGAIECYGDSLTLEFPTEEMRDAFYENFKELIESSKELL